MTPEQPFVIHALELGPWQNVIYVIEDRATARAAVVDPAWDVPSIVRLVEQHGLAVTDILLTHSHIDHINGVDELLAHSDAELHLLKPEAQFWGKELARPSLHHGGDLIRLGHTEIRILHTPGHTPGSACYQLGDHVLTGDTIFVYGCGRCDLKGGDPEQMFHTLRQLATGLPGETVIHPGHNYGITPTSTMAEQVEGNPFFHHHDSQSFVQYRMGLHDRPEPYTPVPHPHRHGHRGHHHH
ncbi:MAG TPA: MBL fold metallo-hydrolase [Candidatus Competibacteraceae bacterium]|nr:MBL fold metallo-hydrolase [Candidatus Competibacteraceae bacterium]